DDLIHRIISQLVRPVISAGRYAGHNGPCGQVDDFHRAVAVACPKLIPFMDDQHTVWTGQPGSGIADKPSNGIEKGVMFGIDNFDASRPRSAGAICKVVGLARGINPTNVEMWEVPGDGDCGYFSRYDVVICRRSCYRK